MRRTSVLLAFVLLILVLGSIPLSKAALGGENFITEVTTAPANSYIVAQDSVGRLFVVASGDLYRSLDAGVTWTKKIDADGSGAIRLSLFVDSRDYIHTVLRNANGTWSYWRSTDNGANFYALKSDFTVTYYFSEFSNGTLTLIEITPLKIWWSHDAGSTWSVHSTLWDTVDHLHNAQADPVTDDFWLATGDGANKANLYKWEAGNWTRIALSTSAEYQTVPILIDSKYVYFFGDGQSRSYRMLKSGNSQSDLKQILDLNALYEGGSIFALSGVRIGEVYLIGGGYGQIWGSWDGEHWIKIVDQNTAGNYFRMFTKKSYPFYVTESTNGKLYRLSITKEDIVHLYYTEYNSWRGSVTNAATYILEQRINAHSQNYIDFSNVALTNVQASIKGLSQVNLGNANMGFEWNNKTGWTETGGPAGTITAVAGEYHDGSYGYKVAKSSGDASSTKIYNPSAQSVERGNLFIVTFWAKANATITGNMKVNFLKNGSVYDEIDTLTINTTWVRYKQHYIVQKNTGSVAYQLEFTKNDCTLYVDSVIVYIDATNHARGWLGSESSQYLEQIQNNSATPSFFTGSLNTLNPSLSIAGQTVSYSGTLTNGTASTAQSLTGTFTGAIQITATISGSEQAILNLTATRTFYEDTTIIRTRAASGVLYGRYYSIFTPTITSTDLIAVTNLASNITSVSYTDSRMILTVNAPSTTTSTTLVYCGANGEPSAVQGATSYSYNSATNILTVEAEHASLATITVTWFIVPYTNPAGSLPTTFQWLSEADLLGFLQSIYVSAFTSVDVLYGFVIMLFFGAIYIRTHSLALISILWILVGSVFIGAMPLVAGLGVLFIILGVAGLLFQLYRAHSGSY